MRDLHDLRSQSIHVHQYIGTLLAYSHKEPKPNANLCFQHNSRTFGLFISNNISANLDIDNATIMLLLSHNPRTDRITKQHIKHDNMFMMLSKI